MDAIFIELPAFERNRERYLDDYAYSELQAEMMRNPFAGDVVEATGGLRKLRFGDLRRGKGKRSGLRVIYYYWIGGPQFWLYTLYGKDEAVDLSFGHRTALRSLLKNELKSRTG